MADPALAAIFAAGAGVSLGASWRLVVALERVGARLGVSEALLGMLAAAAADAPEITAATTALLGHQDRIGAGVVIGSNVFNLAALIGIAGIVAGHIALHRRVVELSGAVAMWICGLCLALVLGALQPIAALVLALLVFIPYLVVLGAPRARIAALPVPAAWTTWLTLAIGEEEQDLEAAIHPDRGGRHDAFLVIGATLVVVAASIAMERSASTLGEHHGVAEIVTGGIVLAAVTSLPNAVAGIYLAMHGRGAATLSTSLNSNAINVLAGLLIPTTFVGIASPSGPTTFVAVSYAAMTVLALGFAYTRRGLGRWEGVTIVTVYLVFVAVLVATS